MAEGMRGVMVGGDEEYMRMALGEASLAAQEGEVPIGAVVVYDPARDPASPHFVSPEAPRAALDTAPEPRVIARAHNRREHDEDPSAHAEFSAMLAAARELCHWRLSGCTVYVTLEPCLMCAGLMVNSRVDRCVFGAADPKGGALGSLYDLSCDGRLNHGFDVTRGVLAQECSQLLRDFFRERRAARRRG
ncbi:nucleoside deaminase [Olsenella urininfantis]|uniref:nucleoside deaminase n=1 Tax=Olsenella urininfantis TaxID=1871033 RepID=UPI000BE7F0D0|nr:nucleoside deaminase [Olsenella urininfantis]